MENNSYNILINYKGDGDFKFIIKRIGEVTITKQRPIYIYNATVEVINDLRTLRRLLLEVTIGAKPTGAYKVYDYNDYTDMPKAFVGRKPNLKNTEPMSNSDISAILKGGSKVEEPIIEETKEEVKPEPDKKPEVKKQTNNKKKSTNKKSTK